MHSIANVDHENGRQCCISLRFCTSMRNNDPFTCFCVYTWTPSLKPGPLFTWGQMMGTILRRQGGGTSMLGTILKSTHGALKTTNSKQKVPRQNNQEPQTLFGRSYCTCCRLWLVKWAGARFILATFTKFTDKNCSEIWGSASGQTIAGGQSWGSFPQWPWVAGLQ